MCIIWRKLYFVAIEQCTFLDSFNWNITVSSHVREHFSSQKQADTRNVLHCQFARDSRDMHSCLFHWCSLKFAIPLFNNRQHAAFLHRHREQKKKIIDCIGTNRTYRITNQCLSRIYKVMYFIVNNIPFHFICMPLHRIASYQWIYFQYGWYQPRNFPKPWCHRTGTQVRSHRRRESKLCNGVWSDVSDLLFVYAD